MGRPVTLEQVNAFVWGKQHLAPQAAGSGILAVVRDVVGLHATSPLTPYLSLRARLAGFQPEQLDAELFVKRRLVKVLCMRQTVHVVPVDKLATVASATGERLRRNARRELGQLMRWAGYNGPAEQDAALTRLQTAIAEVITARGPSTAAELSDAIPELRKRIVYAPDKPYASEVALGSVLLPRLGMLGLVMRGKPRGSWRSNLYEYALLRDWLPEGNRQVPPPAEAQARLLQDYLAAFGPASLDDAAWWAGWSRGEVRSALKVLGTQAAPLQIEGLGTELWLLADQLPALASTPPLAGGRVQLLPTLDGYIMGYHERQRFLDPRHHDQVFDRSGNAFATVWIDGQVAGIWQEQAGAIECLLWEGLDNPKVASEAQALGQFLHQGDSGQATETVAVGVAPYPADLYAKTPFTLGRR